MIKNVIGIIIGLSMIGLGMSGMSGMSGCSSTELTEGTQTTVENPIEFSKASDYAVKKNKLDFVWDARPVGSDGHIMYEIENGSVTCIEHRKRKELACWQNDKPDVPNVEERTSYQ